MCSSRSLALALLIYQLEVEIVERAAPARTTPTRRGQERQACRRVDGGTERFSSWVGAGWLRWRGVRGWPARWRWRGGGSSAVWSGFQPLSVAMARSPSAWERLTAFSLRDSRGR